MLQKFLLGIIFFIALLLGTISLSFADYSSPRIQLESGISIENIQCKENHILVLRTNGSPACVTEKTIERTGWEIIQQNIIYESKNTAKISKDYLNDSITKNDWCDTQSVCDNSIISENSDMQESLTDNTGKKDEQVSLASYAEYQKMFDKNFRLFPGVGWVDMSGNTSNSIMHKQNPETGEMFLNLDAMFDKKPVIFPEDSLMHVHTDKVVYNYNDMIHVTGKISDVVAHPCSETSVSADIRNPDHSRFNQHAFTEVNSDCSYEVTIEISDSQWLYTGTYTINVHTGNGYASSNTEIELISGFTPPQKPFDPNDIVLDLSSPTEFVDDGREYPRTMGHRGPPQLIYDSILESHANFNVDENGIATFTSIPHEKYSRNDKQGYYIEDWLPAFIPEGQRLLSASTGYSTFELNGNVYETYATGSTFVPTTFTLTPFTTNHHLNLAKGFHAGVTYSTLPHDEIEDSIEHLREFFIDREDGYGEIRELTRDGKTVVAFAGGNSVNPYRASVYFHPDEFICVGVNSNYHTLDELIPIFDSVMK